MAKQLVKQDIETHHIIATEQIAATNTSNYVEFAVTNEHSSDSEQKINEFGVESSTAVRLEPIIYLLPSEK